MKPRTKQHVQVLRLSENYLFKLTGDQEEWAKRECLEHKAFATKNSVNCMDCGGSFSPTLVVRKKAVCPHCDTKVTVEQNRKRTDRQIIYFAIAEVVQDIQVIRHWRLSAEYKAGQKAYYSCYEILQHWILPNGKREVIARNHHTNWNCDSWNGYLEIRDKNHTRKYDVYPQRYHPCSVFKPEYAKHGINADLAGLSFIEAIRILPNNPQAETLLKAKQYSLLSYCDGYNYRISRHWPSIKICLRRRFKIKDASTWLDYLDLLESFNKDLRSPVYVCARDFKTRHDKMVAKRRELQRKQQLEDKRKRIEKAEKDYLANKKAFFGLVFCKDNLTIKVLESVKEFIEEGDTHKHCLFTNDYYAKPDSLIFSARVDGKPVETVEVSLSTLKIIQSRGFGNNATEHNKQIISLMKRNIPEIKSRIQQVQKTA